MLHDTVLGGSDSSARVSAWRSQHVVFGLDGFRLCIYYHVGGIDTRRYLHIYRFNRRDAIANAAMQCLNAIS